MQVRLLGSVDVTVAGTPQVVSGLRRKAVLATLALHPGQIVSTDRLIDVVWAGRAPATAVNTVQRHVSHLRAVFGVRHAIVARPPGYLLDIGPEGTDVEGVERLTWEARRADQPAARVTLLRSALAHWRGQPLADITCLPWLEEQAGHLNQLRTSVSRALVDARLAAGEHTELIPELQRLAHEHPLDEEIHGQLMLALYRAGRQSDALAIFRRLRQVLGADLGIDPSRALRDLETAILRQDAAVDAPAPITVAPPAPSHPVPAQLPPTVSGFVGRTVELAALEALLPSAHDRPGAPAPVVISALSGTAGVGKTALAVHWVHRVAGRFPDGQLYVNLRGYDPGAAAPDPGDVLRGFLEALGVPPARIPADPEGRAGLYRSVLAGRRVLVLLDNASDAEQVRPLLPGAPGCLVVVTSRQPLTPLVATEGAHPLALDLLTRDEARNLLARRLGARRVAAEPDAVEELIDRCARLPLALAVSAARAAVQPRLPLATLAAQLRDAAGALDALRGGDAATDIRAVFSWSYDRLTSDAARLFRLLGLHPGPDIGRSAAASLAGLHVAEVDRLLTELTRANLLAEQGPSRFTFHDLLRAYAAEQAADTGTEDDHRGALGRVYDHYLHTAHTAALTLHPHFSPITLPAPRDGVTVARIATRADATAWFAAETSVLLAVVPAAARAGLHAEAWRTAWTMSGLLDRSGRWSDWLAVQQVALDASARIGDRSGQGHAHRDLGRVYSRLRRHDEAVRSLQQALVVFHAAEDHAGEAHTRLNLGQVLERQGHHAEALNESRRALVLFQRAGSMAGEAYTLNAVGWQHSLLGDHHKALASCERAVELLRRVGDVQGEADAWDSLGYAHHQLAEHRRAIACYGNAVTLFRRTGDRYSEASTLHKVGDSYRSVGDTAAARASWQRALSVLDDLGHPDADDIRARLQALATAAGSSAAPDTTTRNGRRPAGAVR